MVNNMPSGASLPSLAPAPLDNEKCSIVELCNVFEIRTGTAINLAQLREIRDHVDPSIDQLRELDREKTFL